MLKKNKTNLPVLQNVTKGVSVEPGSPVTGCHGLNASVLSKLRCCNSNPNVMVLGGGVVSEVIRS